MPRPFLHEVDGYCKKSHPLDQMIDRKTLRRKPLFPLSTPRQFLYTSHKRTHSITEQRLSQVLQSCLLAPREGRGAITRRSKVIEHEGAQVGSYGSYKGKCIENVKCLNHEEMTTISGESTTYIHTVMTTRDKNKRYRAIIMEERYQPFLGQKNSSDEQVLYIVEENFLFIIDIMYNLDIAREVAYSCAKFVFIARETDSCLEKLQCSGGQISDEHIISVSTSTFPLL